MKTLFKLTTLFIILFSLMQCTEKSELGDLEPNILSPAYSPVNIYFEVDSTYASQTPYLDIFYHIKYDQLPTNFTFSKINIYKNGELRFRLSPSQSNAFSPRDYWVNRFNTYNYQFAFEAADGSVSTLSEPYTIYVP